MKNRIKKTGVVAVALAASALLVTPAMAQQGNRGDRGDRSVSQTQARGESDNNVRRDRDGRQNNRQTARQNFNNRSNANNRLRVNNRVHVNNRRNVKQQKVWRNEFGQTRGEVQYLANRAIYACSCQLELDSHNYGYQGATFREKPYYEQVGKNRFIIKGTAKLFDGYDYSRQDYDCLVKRERVKNASNLYPVQHANNGHRNRRNGFTTFNFSLGKAW